MEERIGKERDEGCNSPGSELLGFDALLLTTYPLYLCVYCLHIISAL